MKETTPPLYIFLTNTISGVGGGQLYIADKARRLIEAGWEVRIIHYHQGEIVIPALCGLESEYCPELSLRFEAVPAGMRRRLARRFLGRGVSRPVTVESYNAGTAMWGEYMAQLAGGNAMVYLLTESIPRLTRAQRTLFAGKLAEGKLFGITPRNIPELAVREGLGECRPDGATFLQALGCGLNPEADADDDNAAVAADSRFTFLTISRLDKPFVPHMMQAVSEFCTSHADVPFRFIIVGDAESPALRDRILQRICALPNLSVDFRGYLYPVPRALFRAADIFIGSSGSCRVAGDAGVPTVAIDAADFKAIGILGETTTNNTYRLDGEPVVEIGELIAAIYDDTVSGRRSRTGRKVPGASRDDALEFRRHLDIAMRDGDSGVTMERMRPDTMADHVYHAVLSMGLSPLLMMFKKLKQRWSTC